MLTLELVYVDPKSVGNSFTSSHETERRLVIAKAIWDEKAKIATPGDPDREYRASWEEVRQIIRQADAIVMNSSQQISQPSQSSQSSQLFSYDAAGGGTEPPVESAFKQPSIPDSQSPSAPIPQASPHNYTSMQLPNPGLQGPASPVVDTRARPSFIECAPSEQAVPLQGSYSAAATSVITPETIALHGSLKDCEFYTEEEFVELFNDHTGVR
jgi:hypothetical protein